MTTLTYNTAVGIGFGWNPTGNGYTPITGAKVSQVLNNAKNVALFFAAPFIGLAYLLAFPFVGLAMIAWIACKAVMKNVAVRRIAIAIAAPFIALAFVTVGPVVGLGALVWIGGRAMLKT
ncbi:MAG: hypothetical protein HY017_04875 [Betaproteobacteria bacterium]|nr:hypothetical protein [Betaproteobacteria bacterium]